MNSRASAGSAGYETSRGTGALLIAWWIATLSLWIFAFYEIPDGADDWIRRAQVACFGSDESGMPGAAGWMLLTLSPLALLGAIVLALGGDVRRFVVGLREAPFGRSLKVAIASVTIGVALWVGTSIEARLSQRSIIVLADVNQPLPQSYARGTKPAPDFRLINQHGVSTQLSSLRGRPVVLSFIFAHCQTVCPSIIKSIQRSTADLAPGSASVLFVTLDPWRDTPASLPRLASLWKMGPQMFVLSGSPAEVNAVLDAYEVPRTRNANNGDVVHPALVSVIDRNGALAYSFNNPSPEWLGEAIRRTAH